MEFNWIFIYFAWWIIAALKGVLCANSEIWPLERPDTMPAIQSLEVMCGKDHMDVHLQFTQPFEGIVSSKGQYGDPRCVYVPPSTSKTFYTFRIAYARCGTKPDLNGQFYENTVVVQYDKDLLEVWDEAKRLRCEWYNDYEKTASKPPMVIADLDVIQLDFRGDNVDCWMEIQHGRGPWAPPVSGIVPLGSTLTLVVAINDFRGEFDMRVKSCVASDGGGHVIELSDEHGCVLRPKMISKFLKAKISDEKASVVTYAFFHAFKFPDALNVHIKCKVEICRHGCLEHCQQTDNNNILEHQHDNPSYPSLDDYNYVQRKDSDHNDDIKTIQKNTNNNNNNKATADNIGDLMYDDKINIDDVNDANPIFSNNRDAQALHNNDNFSDILSAESSDLNPTIQALPRRTQNIQRDSQEKFPHGPRKLKEDINAESKESTNLNGTNDSNSSKFQKRRRRSYVVPDSKASNANIGVSGLYEVISEADLAFTPDKKEEAVTVFQGKIREEVVYGICLPVPGFSAIFILMTISAIVSAIVAGFLLYRYQIQRERHHQASIQQHRSNNNNNNNCNNISVGNSLASWMALKLIKSKESIRDHKS